MPSTTSGALRLGVTVGGHQGWITAPLDAAEREFVGSVDVESDLGSFLTRLGDDLKAIDPAFDASAIASAVADLDVTLTTLACRYEAAADGAVSGSYVARCRVGETGTAQFFYQTATTSGKTPVRSYAFGLAFDGAIELTSTPIFGGMLAGIDVAAFALVYSSTALPGSITLPGDDAAATIAGPFPQGASLAFTLQAKNTQQSFVVSLGGGGTRALRDGPAPPAPSSGFTKWFPVQKTLGPLSVQRVGAGYVNKRISLLLDAAVTVSVLTVALKEFSVGVSLSIFRDPLHPDVAVGLGGLGVTFTSGPVSLSGAFLETTRDGRIQYAGEAQIEAATFKLSAIGAYSTDVNGHPSFFVFALLDKPLGGPAFFFVTGVAAGFGYGRSLTLPTLDALPAFPLIAGVTSDATHANPFAGKANDPAAALSVLDLYVRPMPGENWLAAGVRFTSFEMVQSFALATLAFGTDTRFGLLGLSALTVPTGAAAPIAYAELALEATFVPDTGVLAVAGALTPASYVLSRDCKLTGGFAFYCWFKDAGDVSAGEFVATLGGYHPLFRVPGTYPAEPRLAANWQVNGNLSVKGSFYFALTPSAVMGGGALEANWESGDLCAWFDTSADFLLSWKPFHYAAHIELTLGASYRLDLVVTSKTITVSLGVALDLWGPSFAGTARVDLYVVSFTISFGDSQPKLDPISWTDFKSSFLPHPTSPAGLTAAADTPVVFCDIRVTGGLIRDLTRFKAADTDMDWVLDAEDFEVTAWAICPASAATFATKAGQTSTPVPGDWTKAKFGVGPVGVADGKLVSPLVVSLDWTTLGADGHSWVPDATCDLATAVRARPVTSAVPSAPWRRDVALNPVIPNINQQPRVVAALTGVALGSNIPDPAHTPLPIAIVTLEATPDRDQPTFKWSTPDIATTDSFDQATAMAALKQTIDSGPAGARAVILAALREQGIRLSVASDVMAMKRDAEKVLLSAPVLMFLGEERAPSAPRKR